MEKINGFGKGSHTRRIRNSFRFYKDMEGELQVLCDGLLSFSPEFRLLVENICAKMVFPYCFSSRSFSWDGLWLYKVKWVLDRKAG